MTKSYTAPVENAESIPSPEDLALIHAFTRKAVTAEEVYTFPVILCDNEIDRDLERFSEDALNALATLFVGKTGLFNHSMDSHDQTARIYKAACLTDAEKKTSYGAAYTYVRAMAYMPRTEENTALIQEIELGIKKEVSVGCAVSEVLCSVCGANQRLSPCTHGKGQVLDGAVCHHILSSPTDAYEWSFVAVPAQRKAGVTKAYNQKEDASMQDVLKTIRESDTSVTIQGDALSTLQKQIHALQADAALGKTYKNNLVSETLRLGLAAMPDLDAKMFRTACERLTAEELTALHKGLCPLAEKQMPLQLQLSATESAETTNTAFMI